jgi:DNA-binding MarR family transcriptional regulator
MPGYSTGVPEDRQGELTQALRDVMRASHEASLGLARRLDLGLNDVAALDLLSLVGPLGPVELGERLGIRSASATALVDRLEAAGHVERRRDSADRRRVTVVPTDHAHQEAMAAMGSMLAGLDAAAADLTDEQREAVTAYLRRVAEVLHAYGAGEA